MDNHLAAGWSWVTYLDINKSYNLIHIDKHYDLISSPEAIKTEIIDKNIKLNELSFEQYLSIKQFLGNDSTQLFTWDNYIKNIKLIYPSLFGETHFTTFKNGTIDSEFVDKEYDFLELFSEMDYWISRKSNNGWIINLDIDYFFIDFDDRKIQLFTDEFIEQLALKIDLLRNKVDVITISLSPECCGGWDNSFKIIQLICKVLNLKFMDNLRKIVKKNINKALCGL